MRLTRFFASLAVACLLAGCSHSKSDDRSDYAATVTRAKPIEPVLSGSVDSAANAGRIVQAVHVEPQLPELPTASVPSPLDIPSAVSFPMGAGDDYQQSSRALGAAIKALKTKLSVISHNLANAETIGFKRSRVAIENSGYEQVKLPGAQDAFNNYAPTGIAVGQGCRVQSVETDFSQGPLKETGRPLDIAIEGDGFFYVVDPSTNDMLYARAGNLAINANGLLVVNSSSTGRLLQPQISIPIDTTALVISAEGNVSIKQFGQEQYSQIGQIQLAKFKNPQGLLALSENLYQETLASGKPIFTQPGLNGLGTLRQGALEQSNVDFDEELLAWRATQRTLQALVQLLAAPALSR
jgi:flagellar basal-body rod protein FlgG